MNSYLCPQFKYMIFHIFICRTNAPDQFGFKVQGDCISSGGQDFNLEISEKDQVD